MGAVWTLGSNKGGKVIFASTYSECGEGDILLALLPLTDWMRGGFYRHLFHGMSSIGVPWTLFDSILKHGTSFTVDDCSPLIDKAFRGAGGS